MDIIFPKKKMAWIDESGRLRKQLEKEGYVTNKFLGIGRMMMKKAWLKLLRKEAEKKKWTIIRVLRKWELPIGQGTIGVLWNDGNPLEVKIVSITLSPGYYILTKEKRLHRVIPNF